MPSTRGSKEEYTDYTQVIRGRTSQTPEKYPNKQVQEKQQTPDSQDETIMSVRLRRKRKYD